MEEEFYILIEIIKQLYKDKKSVKKCLSDKDNILTWIKVETFVYSSDLYYNITLLLEDPNNNTVESSLDQIQLSKPILKDDLHEKYFQLKKNLLIELKDFQADLKE